MTNLRNKLDNDPTLLSKIYILIILDKDDPYIEEEETHGSTRCMIKYQNPSNIIFLPKTEIGKYLIDQPGLSICYVPDYHRKSEKVKETARGD